MARNKNMSVAKKVKNDEFYTQLADIDAELSNYKGHFVGKIVYCNCDDPRESQFFRYFVDNFRRLGLKMLLATSYDKGGHGTLLEFNGNPREIKLRGDGDFRSKESIKLLKRADIVITNPPFSLFREYIAQLIEHEKKFIVIGPNSQIITKEIWPLYMDQKIWPGRTSPKKFVLPDGTLKDFGNIGWYTNLEHGGYNEQLVLSKKYTPEEYQKYENYNAIEVDRVANIPMDYEGIMGVPESILGKLNPEQFEVVWQASGNTRASTPKDILRRIDYQKADDGGGAAVVDGERKWTRILIQRRSKVRWKSWSRRLMIFC